MSLLLNGELTVGRDCDGLLLADSEVSRRHLRLRRMGMSVEVTDLGSTNGTFIDGAPLSGARVIDGNNAVTLGDTTITMEAQPPAPPNRLGLGVATTLQAATDTRKTSIDLVADTLSSVGSHPASALVDDNQSDIEVLGPGVFDGETVSIVFSDIEASTQRATQMGDRAWFALLDEHNRLFRHELRHHGGREVKSIGDGFMLTFPSVRRALRFATRVQQQVEADAGPDLRVRMGIHTGEAIVDGTGDLFGRHVILAARVANLATGGQILATMVVREIAIGRDDIAFGPPELAELQGFAESQTVHEVLWQQTTL